uniref:Uncharacterized protein n=1 Tax=Romanomermis culicivorax TaxID=13658 RepID=A0A915K3G5_ROMCU
DRDKCSSNQDPYGSETSDDDSDCSDFEEQKNVKKLKANNNNNENRKNGTLYNQQQNRAASSSNNVHLAANFSTHLHNLRNSSSNVGSSAPYTRIISSLAADHHPSPLIFDVQNSGLQNFMRFPMVPFQSTAPASYHHQQLPDHHPSMNQIDLMPTPTIKCEIGGAQSNYESL